LGVGVGGGVRLGLGLLGDLAHITQKIRLKWDFCLRLQKYCPHKQKRLQKYDQQVHCALYSGVRTCDQAASLALFYYYVLLLDGSSTLCCVVLSFYC
jgi:hypothetical protein